MLTWLISPDILNYVMKHERIIKCSDFIVNLRNVTDAIAEVSDKDIELLNYYCNINAFRRLTDLVNKKKKTGKSTCGTCLKLIKDKLSYSVICERCFIWYHFSCTDYTDKQENKVWFCTKCKQKNA